MTNNLINFPIFGNLIGNLHSPKGSCNSQNNLLEKVGHGLLLFFIYLVHGKKKILGRGSKPCTFGLKWDFNHCMTFLSFKLLCQKKCLSQFVYIKKNQIYFSNCPLPCNYVEPSATFNSCLFNACELFWIFPQMSYYSFGDLICVLNLFD